MNVGRFLSSASSGRQTLVGAAVLVGVLAAAAGTALVIGAGRPRWTEAVAVAAAVCLVSSLGGWLAARRKPADPALAVAGVLAASALRILVPLGALAWLSAQAAPLREAGADGLIVAFYLPLLATTLVLHMMVESPSHRGPPRPN